MLRILGKRRSINVRKVLWTCDEIGIGYRQEEWGAGARPLADPEFLALSPKGLVPVMVDDGAVLTESNTIVRYLCARHRRDDLLPQGALARARVEEAMDWQATEFNAAWRIAFQALVRQDPDAGTAAQVARSLDAWTAMLALLDRRLDADGPFVCGPEFTAADIVIGLSVNRWLQAPIGRPHFAAVNRYFRLLLGRGAARRHLGGDTD